MAKFHTLRVADIRRETADCVSIAFDVPHNLQSEYTYIQGQYLTLKIRLKGEEIRRSYSLCSSPTAEKEWRIAVKKVIQGKGSTYLNDELKVGDQMEVMTPMGNFYTPLEPSKKKRYVLFAGGSGITPMLSIIRTILKEEPQSTLHLIYGNKDEASTIFKKALEDIALTQSARFTCTSVLEHPASIVDPLYQGMLSKDKVSALFSTLNLKGADEYFICGPGPMMENVKQALKQEKVEDKKVHIEYFTAVLEAVNKAEASNAASSGGMMSRVTVIMDGKETEFELSSEGDVILDKALDEGVDVPYACKGAVCCTCRAKLKEGKVKMDNNYALTDGEVKEGYILTCQSHPLTEKVVVDYDC